MSQSTKPSEFKGTFIAPENEFVIYYTGHSHYMEFWVLEIAGTEMPSGRFMFGDNCSIENPDEAQPLMNGSVKWDGCMDLDIGGSGISYRNHFCGLNDALALERVIRAIYALAKQHIPHYDKELAS